MNFILNLIALALSAAPSDTDRADPALLIANLVNPSQASIIARDYKLELLDTTKGGPFALYEVSEFAKHQIQVLMNADVRIVWVEDDYVLGSPEGENQRPEDIRARAGGTIPAVFNSKAGRLYNKEALSQINWQLTPYISGLDRNVGVAILDTGLSPFQPELWQNVVATLDATGSGSVYDLPADLDTNGNGLKDEAVGHGTFVTSIIATVAPYANIAVAKVADSDGIATSWTIIKGLVFAVQSGCELVNISLGSVDRPKALSDVLDWTEANGLTIIAGVGNDDDDRITFPARYSKVIAVAGLDPVDVKASFSNYEGSVDQSAPAVLVAGAWWKGGMVGWSGTSFSTPFVTGCLADTARKRDFWSPSEVRALAENIGTNIDSINPNYEGKLGLKLNWQMLWDEQS